MPEALAAVFMARKEYQIQNLERRQRLEPRIASLAAQRATRDEMSRMEMVLDLQSEKVCMGESGAELDRVFHYLIAQATGNTLLLRTIDTAKNLFSENRGRYLQYPGRPEKSFRLHEEILRAITARDGSRAADVMINHLDDIHETLFATD